MSSKVDRELAEIEAQRAAEQPRGGTAKKGLGPALRRIAKDLMVRRHSTKR